MPLPDPRKQTAARIQRTEAYAKKIQRMFSQTVNDLLALPLAKADLQAGQMFSFDAETDKVQRQAEQLLRRLHAAATLSIQKGVAAEWEQANKAADAILQSQFSKKALSSPYMKGWNARNHDAMEQFVNRSDYGMNLSQRVWQSCRQLRDEMEVALTISIGEGEDAGTISRRVRQYLNDPDLMFRRFRYKDDDGRWQSKWKKRIKDPDRPGRYRFIDYDKDSYKDEWTGRGYYKSSAQNAMRVARTETNIAYRRADHARWQGLDFVLGQRVQLSRNHPEVDICDKLAGDYPKDFVFDGWHPQCFCYVTPILVDEKEMEKMNEAFVKGEDYAPQGEQITEYPEGFKDWVRDNEAKIKEAQRRGTEPYFIRNNAEIIEDIIKPKAPKDEEKIEKAKWFDTPEQADNALRKQAGEFWRSLNSDEKELFAEYTGEGYAEINRAMRGLNTSEPFAKENGEDLKWLINNCRMEHPIWVQRVETIDGLKRFGIVDPESASLSDLKSLVGRTFENESFISTCVAKGSAEKQDIDYGILFDIKVPKGTSAIYVEPFSTYGNGDGINWDGLSKQKTIGSEAELLINAGQKLMVTGAKLKDGIWHIELEVVTKETAKGASLKGSSKAETRRVLKDVIDEDYVGRVHDYAQDPAFRQYCKKLGINPDKVKPMSFLEADSGNSNKYRGNSDYDNNCVGCTLTNELRRRGLNVTAGMEDSTFAIDFLDCWRTKTGEKPNYLIEPDKLIPKSEKETFKQLDKLMNIPNGRYIIGWNGKGKVRGHVLCAERINGELVYYDPQLGKNDCFWTLGEILDEMDKSKGFELLRIDNLYLNSSAISKIVKNL